MNEILLPEQWQYLEQKRRPEDQIIMEMESYAREHKVPILDWKSAELLEQIIMLKSPKRVLEIGTAIAYSSIRMARSLSKDGKVYTIEHSQNNAEIATENILRSGLKDRIKLITGDAQEIMPEMDKKFDLIFLDADKEDYLKLFDYSLDLLKNRGILFVDNLLWHGYTASANVPQKFVRSTAYIREFNQVFLSCQRLHSVIYPVGDGIGIGIKKKKE